MRVLLLTILLAPLGAAFAATDLAACAGIESAVERLDCYDRLAHDQARSERSGKPADGQRDRAAAMPSERAPPAPRAEAPSSPTVPADEEAIAARIIGVRKAPLGEQILTLSNGQVWIENEPGRRRIALDQNVIIRKRRWHHVMELPSQPDVSVRRVR